jgi:hypothetical protein
MKFLYAAYAATWIIHVAYMGTIARRYARLRDKVADFKKRP